MDHAPAQKTDSDPDPLPAVDVQPGAPSGAEREAQPEAQPEAEPVTEPSSDLSADSAPASEPGAEPTSPVDAQAPTRAAGPIQDRVIRALKAQITPALPAELALALDVPEKTLKRLLGKMARDGSVRRSGGGRFTASRHYRG